jgi:two-component system chemotaxis response regulator CheY
MTKSCLIVDDSRIVRRVARRIFEDMKFTCAEAEDGQQAVDSCAENMPDVVLLDWNMPVMTGIEFLAKLRAMKNGKHPKVIFCTVEKNKERMDMALNGGANGYIVKPFDNDTIQTKLRNVGIIE